MALIYADRVKETTATTGTGTLTLAGAVAGFQTFAAVANANTCDYCLLSGNGTDWETGTGTYTVSGTTLSRTSVYASSNSGSLISITGTSTVFLAQPAHRVPQILSAKLGGSVVVNPTPVVATGITGLSVTYPRVYVEKTVLASVHVKSGPTNFSIGVMLDSTLVMSGAKAPADSDGFSLTNIASYPIVIPADGTTHEIKATLVAQASTASSTIIIGSSMSVIG